MSVARICQIMQRKGQTLLQRYEKKTGIPVTGKISFTADGSIGYAQVYNDPEYDFAVPGSRCIGAPPEYVFWIGENEKEARNMLKAFSFALSHEVAHVIDKISISFFAMKIIRAPEAGLEKLDRKLQVGAEELMIDRAAVELGFLTPVENAMLLSMVRFSQLVLEDYQRGRWEDIRTVNLARELVKLKWIMNKSSISTRLRSEAQQTFKSYNLELTKRGKNWQEIEQLMVVYHTVFSNTKIEIPR